MPPTIFYEHATGFSLFKLRAVLSGRVTNSSIDLAKVNLLR